MFEGFAHVWTPVAFSSELPAQAPLRVQVAGTPVVLFRDALGAPAALVDRCPHRGVALSLGRVTEGCIECPFHGWQLDGTGQVRRVPWNPDAKLATLRGMSVPAREVAGQIWIYTDVEQPPASEPTVSEKLVRAGVRVSGVRTTWEAHWTRAMENMLDWPHLPFVHKKTIGRRMVAQTAARMDVFSEATAWGMTTRIEIDGKAEATTLDLRFPNQMNLHIAIPGKVLVMAVACIPESDTRTTMLLGMARSFMTSPLMDPVFNRSNRRIAKEDQAIVESSSPREVPPPGEEQSVRTDAVTLAFRKRYFSELRGSSSTRGEGRECAPR